MLYAHFLDYSLDLFKHLILLIFLLILHYLFKHFICFVHLKLFIFSIWLSPCLRSQWHTSLMTASVCGCDLVQVGGCVCLYVSVGVGRFGFLLLFLACVRPFVFSCMKSPLQIKSD